MTLQKQITFWVGSFLVLILVLWLLSPILLPFIAGLVLAYFLDPVADALERLGLPRVAATAAGLRDAGNTMSAEYHCDCHAGREHRCAAPLGDD